MAQPHKHLEPLKMASTHKVLRNIQDPDLELALAEWEQQGYKLVYANQRNNHLGPWTLIMRTKL